MSTLLDQLLDAERLAACEAADEHARAERARVVRGEPYIWPMVPWRTDTPQRRLSEPRASRFGDLQ